MKLNCAALWAGNPDTFLRTLSAGPGGGEGGMGIAPRTEAELGRAASQVRACVCAWVWWLVVPPPSFQCSGVLCAGQPCLLLLVLDPLSCRNTNGHVVPALFHANPPTPRPQPPNPYPTPKPQPHLALCRTFRMGASPLPGRAAGRRPARRA